MAKLQVVIMAGPQEKPKLSRIQKANQDKILEGALDVFSQTGFAGATLDAIAAAAGLSKPNVLYYFASKEAIHQALLTRLLETWLEPLDALDPQGDPVEEILSYVRRKIVLARDYPRESRLFANEILQGAPRILPYLEGELNAQVAAKCAVLQGWMDEGRIASMLPQHLIFAIWSTTQHYADFDVQVRAVLGSADEARYEQAEAFLTMLFRRLLSP